MAFIQIMELTTTRPEDIEALVNEWQDATRGQRKVLRGTLTRDRDKEDTYVQIVEFPSYEEAMANSSLPATTNLAEQMGKLCDGPISFRNLEVELVRDLAADDAVADQRMYRQSFDEADEVRAFEGGMGQLEFINSPSGPVGRATFHPGWRWSEHVKPIAGTDSCQAPHVGYCVSGRMKVVMDDGSEMEAAPGDFAIIPPGHDAWIVGDEDCVMLDWQGFADYAKR
jgi:quercetin dioxygenase-like cupin family protein